MGSQLRFDPSFFGLALRASAEADALLFSAHEGLSGITRPARAGLRLTSPAKASGGRSSMHKERIPLHKESGFLCRERKGWQRPGYVKNTSGPGRVRKGMKEARASRRSNGVRVARGENTPQHIIACQGAVVKGNIPRGVSGGGRGSGGESDASTAATAAGYAWGNERK